MANLHDPRQNHFLRALPEATYRRLLPALEPVPLSFSDVVHESHAPLRQVCFPTTAVISVLFVLEGGESAEVAMVGNEGMLGFSLALGARTAAHRAVVQCAGQAFRLSAAVPIEEFRRRGTMAQMLLRYTLTVGTQMAQTALCNRFHTVDQQLCRWLPMCVDRQSGGELVMTQEVISNRLGVRREGITEAASKLQVAGSIQYSRGRIRILDRKDLEMRACECYGTLQRDYDGLLRSYNAP